MKRMISKVLLTLFFFVLIANICSAQNTARGIAAKKIENKKIKECKEPVVVFDSKHNSYITSNIVYSPDEKFVASGGKDRTVRIWSILDKKEVRIFKGHNDEITSIMYSSDGKFIASASKDSTIRIWDIKKSKEIKRFYISSMVKSIAYSPDENFVAVGNYNGFIEIWNIQNECKVCMFNTNDEYETKINSIIYTPDGKYLVTGAENGTVVILNIEKNKQMKKIIYEEPVESIYYNVLNSRLLINFRFGKSKIYDIKIDDEIKLENEEQFDYGVFSIDGKHIITFNYDNEGTLLKLVELKTKKTINEWKKNLRFYKSVLSPDGKKIICLIYNSKASIHTISIFNLNGNLLSEIVVTKDTYPSSLISNILSCDSDFVFSSNGRSDISIFDIKQGKIKKTLHFDVDDWQGGQNWISPDGKRVFFRDHNRFFSINIEKEKIEWSMFYTDDASILGFVPNGDKFVIRYYDKGEFRFFLVDSATGKILSNYSGETQNLYKSISSNSASEKKYSPDGKYFFIHEFGQISVKEVSTDKQVCFIDNVDIFDDCIFLRENPCIAVEKDASIEFWNYYTGKLEYTTILYNKTGIWNYEIDKNNLLDTFFVENWGANYHLVRTDYDYLTYTPEGFFTGTEWAMKNLVHIVDGMDVIGIDQVYDKFYRPDLVAAKMRGEDISEYAKEVNLASIVRSGNAPAVAIENLPELSDSRDVTFDICVQNTGGGIGNVSIVLNGKTIRLSEGVESSKGEQKIFRHTVTLQNGQNKIEAFAMNSAGMIESRRASADVSWQGKTSKPNLYVLTVAVNKYRDKNLWLNYCVPDAASIEESFKKQQNGLYENICVYSLKDAEVTKEGLEQKFKELSSLVTADDVFVFFVSGHGTAYDDGDYYFIPVNFRYTNKTDIPLKAISKSDLTKNLSLIKAGKTLMMLDTCNSGAFFADSNKRGMGDKGIFERLSKATGHAILAAASDSQSAMEGYNGHGVFTYVLLDGLAGNADSDGDGFVTLTELSSYVENQVPELSYEKWGYEQVSQKELRRQDFPIAEKLSE